MNLVIEIQRGGYWRRSDVNPKLINKDNIGEAIAVAIQRKTGLMGNNYRVRNQDTDQVLWEWIGRGPAPAYEPPRARLTILPSRRQRRFRYLR